MHSLIGRFRYKVLIFTEQFYDYILKIIIYQAKYIVSYTIYWAKIQVNFCISNTDMSNTTHVSKWDDSPGRFTYMYDLKKPWYLEHGNLEYMAYLEVDLWTQEQNHMRYLELYKISSSIEFTPVVHDRPVVVILRSIDHFRWV